MRRHLLAVGLVVVALLLLAGMPLRTRAVCDGSEGCRVEGSTSFGGLFDWPRGAEWWTKVFVVASLVLIVAGAVLLIRSRRRSRRRSVPESPTSD